MNDIDTNEQFSLAAETVNHTNCNVFLTGKAGTGKTTFLKYIKENTHKNTVVVAPTGVAAINAAGVTMHSFFQLPFLPYLPHRQHVFGVNSNFADKQSLFRNNRFSGEKRSLINELELLIIDEVSMLRADMLDAIDEVLRYFRGRNKPFGGVQVLFIGDLYQLPPVATEEEWNMLKQEYESPFFFSAKVLEKNPPLFIELKKIYRQKDQQFIDLLNNIRNNCMTDADLELLQSRYNSQAIDLMEGTITLTTHNRIADDINRNELNKLDGPVFSFKGEIKGNFNDKALPTEFQLDLKPGAQVMFIKNDSNGEKRYYNGKLATIKSIIEDKITVAFTDSGEEFTLEKEKWENIQYRLNSESGKVEEEEIGSFEQYPLRLAWAITIHKSQGLTFERAVIDAGRAFAAGQVYVALSRCRNLKGLLLLSHIYPESVKSDERIVAFANRENSAEEIAEILTIEKPKYAAQTLVRTFDWRKIVCELNQLETITPTKQLPDKQLAESITTQIAEKAKEQEDVAEKFITELEKRFEEYPINVAWLNVKVPAAKKYFAGRIKEELITPINALQAHLKGKAKVRQYIAYVNAIENTLWKKIKDIERASFGNLSFEVEEMERGKIAVAPPRGRAVEKGASQKETLEFYKQGMKPDEIAKQRGLAHSTIESHLAEWVGSGEVNVLDFMNEELLGQVKAVVERLGSQAFGPLKAEMGDAVTYGQLKMAVSYWKNKEPVTNAEPAN